MPFESEKQRRWMWANEPEIAARWDQEYGGRIKRDVVRNRAQRRVKKQRRRRGAST